MNIIEIKGLCQSFGDKTILDHIDLSLEEGKIYGLAGDNGSGKSVLLKCMCGLLPFQAGEIKINGAEICTGKGTPPLMGVVIEHPGFLSDMSGFRNLEYLAGIRGKIGRKEINKALECVGLTNDANKKVKKYSLGMRQRLAIAQAVMEDPPIYVMDEPFNGLDKTYVAKMKQLFLELKNKGRTFLLVSHHSQDIDFLCDEVYQIEHGKLLKCVKE